MRKQLGILRSIAIYYWKPFNKRRLKRFYRPFVQQGDLCFDLGAHLGNRTDAWLALGAKVIAVEPQPACIRFLEKQFRSNANFTLVKKAIGATPGQATLHVSQLTPTVTTLADTNWQQLIDEDSSFKVEWDEQVEVEVITLDQLIAQYGLPKFCKIDIENYELEALQGLITPLPCLSLEFYAATIDRAIACIDRLETLGNYEYNWSYGETQKMNSSMWITANDIKEVLSKLQRGDPSGDLYARLSGNGNGNV